MLARASAAAYASQGGVNTYLCHDYTSLSDPVEFILGKALVKSTMSGDIFEVIETGSIPFDSPVGYPAGSLPEISIKIGDPWAFYEEFWTAQGMQHLNDWIEPRIGVQAGGNMTVPLVLTNNTAVDQEIILVPHIPSGWTEATRPSRFRVRAHDICAMEIVLTAPLKQTERSSMLSWDAMRDQNLVGSVSVRAYPGYPYLPQ